MGWGKKIFLHGNLFGLQLALVCVLGTSCTGFFSVQEGLLSSEQGGGVDVGTVMTGLTVVLPATLNENVCSNPITIVYLCGGSPCTAPTATTIDLDVTGGSIYSDSLCTHIIQDIPVNPGDASAQVYYYGTAAGAHSFSVTIGADTSTRVSEPLVVDN